MVQSRKSRAVLPATLGALVASNAIPVVKLQN
jgi:hypothetical protein